MQSNLVLQNQINASAEHFEAGDIPRHALKHALFRHQQKWFSKQRNKQESLSRFLKLKLNQYWLFACK